MSAGTIFVMSGDEIIMGPMAYIGPIDPQVPNKDGQFVPAQSILTLIEDIKLRGEEFLKKGENPPWTDLQILNQIDGKEIGSAINGSKYSIELVENYLLNYKFKSWVTHKDGTPVTEAEKRAKANEVADALCDHSKWKTHSRGITREIAWINCGIRITHTEGIDGLERSLRRFWALLYWMFENTQVFKIFISENYTILRQDRPH